MFAVINYRKLIDFTAKIFMPAYGVGLFLSRNNHEIFKSMVMMMAMVMISKVYLKAIEREKYNNYLVCIGTFYPLLCIPLLLMGRLV